MAQDGLKMAQGWSTTPHRSDIGADDAPTPEEGERQRKHLSADLVLGAPRTRADWGRKSLLNYNNTCVHVHACTRISSVLLLSSCPGHCVVSLSLCPCAGAIASLSLCPCLCVLVCVTVFLSLGVVSVFVSLSLCPCCLVLILVSGADVFLWFGAGDSKRLGIQGDSPCCRGDAPVMWSV